MICWVWAPPTSSVRPKRLLDATMNSRSLSEGAPDAVQDTGLNIKTRVAPYVCASSAKLSSAASRYVLRDKVNRSKYVGKSLTQVFCKFSAGTSVSGVQPFVTL